MLYYVYTVYDIPSVYVDGETGVREGVGYCIVPGSGIHSIIKLLRKTITSVNKYLRSSVIYYRVAVCGGKTRIRRRRHIIMFPIRFVYEINYCYYSTIPWYAQTLYVCVCVRGTEYNVKRACIHNKRGR